MVPEQKILIAQACADTFSQPTVFNMPEEGEFTPSFTYEYSDIIGKISERLFAGFLKEALQRGHPELHTDGILHGYQVIGRGVISCVRSYNKFVRENDHIRNTSTLNGALKNPKSIEFFTDISKLPNKENREYETYFSLKSAASMGFDQYFIFDPEQNCFIPNKVLLQEARLAAVRKRIERLETDNPIEPHERCLATRYIPLVWIQTVDAFEAEGLLAPETSVTEVVR
jgi:hypothetical protein